MYGRRATQFNLHSLKALTKVCSRPTSSSSLFVDKFHLLRVFSTAIQRPDFYRIDESSGEKGTYNFKKNGDLGRHAQNIDRVDGQNHDNRYGQFNLEPGFVENGHRNDFVEYQDGKNGLLSAGHVGLHQKNINLSRGVPNGDRVYGQNSNDQFQQSQHYGGNIQQRWDGGNYGGSYESQHYGLKHGNLQQNWNTGSSGRDFENLQQSGNSGVRPVNSQQSWNAGYNGENSRTLQHNWNADNSGQNSGNVQHSWGVGYSDGSNGPHRNWEEPYTQHVGTNHETSHANYAVNGGAVQFSQGNQNAVNMGTFHGNSGRSSNQGNVGEYKHITGGSLQYDAGFLPQTSNQYESGVKPNEVSESITEDQLKGTIEELDKFYQEGKLKEVVDVLALLEGQHISVDLPRYLLLFKACGEENALEEGKSIHKHLLRSGVHLEVKIHNKILEMYCSCGSLDDALEAFNNMPMRNLTTWDTMISWLAKNGHGEEAVALFTQFKETGLRPDGIMFLGIFSACGSLGDTVEGLLHFESMKRDYSIVPSMDHYISVVDMLGTAGNLDEALEFIEKMPLEPSIEVWEVLMNLCRMHGNLELGDRCAELVEVLDPSRLDEQSKAGYLPLKPSDPAKDKEKNKSGQSLREGRSRVHEYRAGDKSQPELYDLLRGMKQQLKEAGYIPEVKFVLHDIDQEGKEEALMAHSERLAVAQGLLTSPARYPIRIIKNLRICVDCHNTMKIVSKLVGRELIIRDAKRFHHFKDGSCTCRDYW